MRFTTLIFIKPGKKTLVCYSNLQNSVILNKMFDALKYFEFLRQCRIAFFSLLCKLEWTGGNGGITKLRSLQIGGITNFHAGLLGGITEYRG